MYKSRNARIKYYVVETEQKPLLSGSASKQLGLIERIHKIKSLEDFPDLKKATGMLPGTYALRIDPTIPPVIHGPRRQPQALIPKIKAKLDEMERGQQITKVTEPTDWVSSLVEVLKKGKVEIMPTNKDLLKPRAYNIDTVRKQLDEDKGKQKYYHDRKAGKEQPVFVQGDPVMMSPLPGTKNWLPAKVITHYHEPRSYVVEYNGKKYRRNRKDLHLSTYNAYDRAMAKAYEDKTPPLRSSPQPRSPTPQPNSPSPTPQSPPPSKPPKSPRKETTSKATPLESPPTGKTPSTPRQEYVTRRGRVSRPPKRYED